MKCLDCDSETLEGTNRCMRHVYHSQDCVILGCGKPKERGTLISLCPGCQGVYASDHSTTRGSLINCAKVVAERKAKEEPFPCVVCGKPAMKDRVTCGNDCRSKTDVCNVRHCGNGVKHSIKCDRCESETKPENTLSQDYAEISARRLQERQEAMKSTPKAPHQNETPDLVALSKHLPEGSLFTVDGGDQVYSKLRGVFKDNKPLSVYKELEYVVHNLTTQKETPQPKTKLDPATIERVQNMFREFGESKLLDGKGYGRSGITCSYCGTDVLRPVADVLADLSIEFPQFDFKGRGNLSFQFAKRGTWHPLNAPPPAIPVTLNGAAWGSGGTTIKVTLDTTEAEQQIKALEDRVGKVKDQAMAGFSNFEESIKKFQSAQETKEPLADFVDNFPKVPNDNWILHPERGLLFKEPDGVVDKALHTLPRISGGFLKNSVYSPDGTLLQFRRLPNGEVEQITEKPLDVTEKKPEPTVMRILDPSNAQDQQELQKKYAHIPGGHWVKESDRLLFRGESDNSAGGSFRLAASRLDEIRSQYPHELHNPDGSLYFLLDENNRAIGVRGEIQNETPTTNNTSEEITMSKDTTRILDPRDVQDQKTLKKRFEKVPNNSFIVENGSVDYHKDDDGDMRFTSDGLLELLLDGTAHLYNVDGTPYIHNQQEATMSKDTTTTSTTQTTTQILTDDAKEAGFRLATKQLTKLTRETLIATIANGIAAGDDSVRAKVAKFLQGDMGEALHQSLLSLGLSMLPTQHQHQQELARQLRVAAMTTVGDTVADLVMEPLRTVITAYINPALAALPQETTQARVTAPSIEVATMVEDKVTTNR